MSKMGEFVTADMVGLWIGLVGLIIAAYQTYSAHSAKRLYRNGCRIRVRDASDKAQRLADNMSRLCQVVHDDRFFVPISGNVQAAKAYAELFGHVGASLDIAKDWVRFCIRLDEEHKDEFRESALEEKQLTALQTVKDCLAELEGAQSQGKALPMRVGIA